jgi:hypothetical protein
VRRMTTPDCSAQRSFGLLPANTGGGARERSTRLSKRD